MLVGTCTTLCYLLGESQAGLKDSPRGILGHAWQHLDNLCVFLQVSKVDVGGEGQAGETFRGTGERAGWNKYWTQDQDVRLGGCFGSQEQMGLQRANLGNDSLMFAMAFHTHYLIQFLIQLCKGD